MSRKLVTRARNWKRAASYYAKETAPVMVYIYLTGASAEAEIRIHNRVVSSHMTGGFAEEKSYRHRVFLRAGEKLYVHFRVNPASGRESDKARIQVGVDNPPGLKMTNLEMMAVSCEQ